MKLKILKNQYSPTSITEMEFFDLKYQNSNGSVYNKDFENKFGNRYINSLYIDRDSVSFYVNQDYVRMCGTVACPKGTLSDVFKTGTYNIS